LSDADLPEALTMLLDDLTEKTAWMAELERAAERRLVVNPVWTSMDPA